MTTGSADASRPIPDGQADDYLVRIGERLRHQRAQRGMTRRMLAQSAGVSERHIAQFETGHGNISILLLRRLATALGIDVGVLVGETAEHPIERVLVDQMLSRLSPAELAQARRLLLDSFVEPGRVARQHRIALVGLRGAGKSTLGRRLADMRHARFVELDREVENEGGMELRELFEIHGQQGFRHLEFAALKRLIAGMEPLVIATGGSLVTEPKTYEFLLTNCVTIWIKAAPEDHMSRVIAQGDLRPMQDNRSAMDDLRAILASRDALYAKADFKVDTAGKSLDESTADILSLIAAI